MTVSFDGIRKGDTVRIEFASPPKGWAEGALAEMWPSLIQIDHIQLDVNCIQSIAVIEPPIQAGDVALIDGRMWTVTGNGDAFTYDVTAWGNTADSRMLYRDVEFIPSDAVWLVRNGQLTDRVKVSE